MQRIPLFLVEIIEGITIDNDGRKSKRIKVHDISVNSSIRIIGIRKMYIKKLFFVVEVKMI